MIEKEQIELMEQRIQQFNDFVMAQDIEKMPVGLFNGKMGICIFFFYQARITENKKYEKFAKKLLNSVCNQIDSNVPVSLNEGLIGIYIGFIFLVNKKFITEDINTKLEELEILIYKEFSNPVLQFGNVDIEAIIKKKLEIVFFYVLKLDRNDLNKEERFIAENIIIEFINSTESGFFFENYKEPIMFELNTYLFPNYLFLLSRIYKHQFYNYKIDRIIPNISDLILTTFPLTNTNKLIFTGSVECMLNNINVHEATLWKEHLNLIKSHTDINKVISKEFRNKNISFLNGISGLYFLLKYIFNSHDIGNTEFFNKIICSEYWNESYNTINSNNNNLVLTDSIVEAFALFFIYLYRNEENRS